MVPNRIFDRSPIVAGFPARASVIRKPLGLDNDNLVRSSIPAVAYQDIGRLSAVSVGEGLSLYTKAPALMEVIGQEVLPEMVDHLLVGRGHVRRGGLNLS